MDTKKEDTDVRTAPEAPAMPAPGDPGPGPSAVPSVPLHGPVDVADDSLEGLQSAFRALSVEEADTNPVKRKSEREKDARESMADEEVDHGHDPTSESTFEGAPSASGLHASPCPTTTTLPTPDPAATTSTPKTNPPMAEGTGFTGMPTYPAYGVNPPTTAFPEATTTSEPVTSSSAPRWYAADYHHPLPATGAYVDVPGYTTLSGLRRGPESCGSRSRGSGRSSNRSLTRSEIKEKKKKRKTRRPEGRRSQEAKAIATSKIVVDLPEFTGKDLSEFAENFGRFLRLTGQTHTSGRVKCDLLLQCCKTKYLEKQVKQIVTKSATFADVLVALERQYPTHETDLSIRAEIQNLAVLPNNPQPGRVSKLLADLDHWAGRLTPGSYSSDDLLFWLLAKLPRELWDECRSTAERKARALHYEDLCVLLLELALEKESDQHLNNYRPGGGGSGSQGKGYQGSGPGQGTTPKHARIIKNVKELFWCDARHEQRHLQHAPDCEQRDCFVVQGKKQEINTGAKTKMLDHDRCTITCAFCPKRKHYEDECYHKQRLSTKLKGEDPSKGCGKGGGKSNGNNSGKGTSNGVGKGQDKNQGGRGGGANHQPDKDNKNPDKNGGNPNPNPGGNSEPSEGQSGPTTRSQTQAQREQGAKREHEGGDDGNAMKRSCFMRMARKSQNKGFEVTSPAEF